MKRLMIAAALLALSAGAFAEEATPAPAAPAADAVKAVQGKPGRPPFDRAKYEARMRERQEARRAKVAEILAAAGVDAEKAKTLALEIEKVYASRPPRQPRQPREGKKRLPQGERKPAPATP